MKTGLTWGICGVLILGVFFSHALAETPEEIVVIFFDGGYPPFYMASLEEGMFIDFLAAFEQRHPEFKIIRKGLSRKRIDVAMDQGNAQVSSITNPMFVGQEKAGNFLFSKPIWKTGNYILMNKNNAFDYKQPEDLFEKRLGVIFGNRNGILDPYIEAGRIKAMPVAANLVLYKTLEKGRVDSIVANKHVALYEMKHEGIDSSQFIFSEAPIFEYELMTQAQKTYPHFIEKLNAFIEKSQQNGFLEQITEKYLK